MQDNIPDKLRLKRCIEKSMKTVCVGALSIFEKDFGHLWGHGLPDDQLTPEERAYKQRWEEARQEIFDRYHKSQDIVFGACDRVSVKTKQFFERIKDERF